MKPLAFEDHRALSMWIKANGPLPVGAEVRVGERVIRMGRPVNQQEMVPS